MSQQSQKRGQIPALSMIFCLVVAIPLILTACGNQSTTTTTVQTSQSQITYSNKPQDVIIRTYRGGGHLGTLSQGPLLSIYGDGTYVIGLEKQGKLSSDALQQLLTTIVDTDGILTLQRQQFADVPDQNSTFLELNLNGQKSELTYSNFGSRPESAQDMDEYKRLGDAITAINNALNGPTQPFSSNTYALLVRLTYNPDPTPLIQAWYMSDFTLLQVSTYECGPPLDGPNDRPTSANPAGPCLLYTRPQGALELTNTQLQSIKGLLGDQTWGQFYQYDSGHGIRDYVVSLRPLLPDEIANNKLAMLGSGQSSYENIPLVVGTVPQS